MKKQKKKKGKVIRISDKAWAHLKKSKFKSESLIEAIDRLFDLR